MKPVRYHSLTPQNRRRVRNSYVTHQKGLCFYCGAPLSGKPAPNIERKPVDGRLFPTNFFKYPIHLHHCHRTGMTEGAVHNKCNAVLFQYEGK